MPNVEDKARVVEALRAQFEGSPLVVLADFKGVKVKEIDKLRRSAEKGGVRMQVVKNSLCWRALQGTDKQNLADLFKGNIAVLFSGADPIASAKVLKDVLRDNDKFVVRAGFFEGQILDMKGVEGVAALPGREELLSTLLATIQEGPRQLLGVIQGAPRDLQFLLGNLASKLEEGEQPA